MTFRLKPLDQQVIVITGASSGIGLVTAQAAAAAGAKVLLVARSEDALATACAAIHAAGGTADYAVADVGIAGQVEAAAARAISLFGRIDSWVNNAGSAIYAKLLETPLDEHEQLFRTNYFGVVNGVAAAIPRLRAEGGALITISSIAAEIPSPIMGAYAASKHAVRAYIGSLRIELMAEDMPVSVTLIKPSGIDTPIAERSANHGDGEAKVPPPIYDPRLVATAILDAAVHPRREVTVGGAGRAQVLFGTHFPSLFERLSTNIMPILFDPDRPKTRATALFAPMSAGHERSDAGPGRRTSLYTVTERHPGATRIGVLAAGAAIAGALWAARRRRKA